MAKSNSRFLYLALLLLAALPLAAQGGCVDSPEHPTALLALFGVVGFAYMPVKKKIVSALRNRRDQ